MKDEWADGEAVGEADKELLAKDGARSRQDKGRQWLEVIDKRNMVKNKNHQQLAADQE